MKSKLYSLSLFIFFWISCSGQTAVENTGPLDLKRPPDTSFRVVIWNVSGQSMMDAPADFRSVFAAIDPDILLLDEVSDKSSPQEVVAMLAGLRSPADTVWNISFGAGGDYQRTIIASRDPVEQVPAFEFIPYPPGTEERLASQEPDPETQEKLRRGIRSGVGTNAAIVTLGERRLFVGGADLQCCGDDGTWEDQRRELEARLIHEALIRGLDGAAVDGIIFGGDLNLVGLMTPLEILQSELTPKFGALKLIPASHLDGLSTWTWDGRGTEFPSGQLDYALYGPIQLEVLKAFIFDTETMDSQLVQKLSLARDLTRFMSDHRPIVVDYRWRE